MKSVIIASVLALGLGGVAYAAGETAEDTKSSSSTTNSATAPAIEWPVVKEGPKTGKESSGKEANKGSMDKDMKSEKQ